MKYEKTYLAIKIQLIVALKKEEAHAIHKPPIMVKVFLKENACLLAKLVVGHVFGFPFVLGLWTFGWMANYYGT